VRGAHGLRDRDAKVVEKGDREHVPCDRQRERRGGRGLADRVRSVLHARVPCAPAPAPARDWPRAPPARRPAPPPARAGARGARALGAGGTVADVVAERKEVHGCESWGGGGGGSLAQQERAREILSRDCCQSTYVHTCLGAPRGREEGREDLRRGSKVRRSLPSRPPAAGGSARGARALRPRGRAGARAARRGARTPWEGFGRR